jgi:hypothetical protein
MKAIELTPDTPSLRELVELADQENIMMRTPEGRQFVLAELDDFDVEVEQLKRSDEFRAFLDQRSRERGTSSIEQLRRDLHIR